MDANEIKDFFKQIGRATARIPAKKPSATQVYLGELKRQLERFELHNEDGKFGRSSFVTPADVKKTGFAFSMNFGIKIAGLHYFQAEDAQQVRTAFENLKNLIDNADPETLEAISQRYAETESKPEETPVKKPRGRKPKAS